MKKVVLLGDSAVGKTSLVRRYVVDAFDDRYIATIGSKVTKKDLEFHQPGRTIFLTMMVWDVLGQREYQKIRQVSLKGAHGAIVVADLSRGETVQSLKEFWFPEVLERLGELSIIVLGNKADLVPAEAETEQEIVALVQGRGLRFLRSSAKTGLNVEEAFRSLAELMISTELASETLEPLQTPENFAGVIDAIVTDFCDQHGDVQSGMDIVQKEFARAKIDLNAPSREAVMTALEYLAETEADLLGKEVADVNKLRRWRLVEGFFIEV